MVSSSYLNYEWFLKQDFSKYSNKWLAIVDKKVVASDKDVILGIKGVFDAFDITFQKTKNKIILKEIDKTKLRYLR